MAKQDLTRVYTGADLAGATNGVIYLPIVRDATLEKVSFRSDAAQSGAAVFEVRKNNVVIVGLSVLTITNGAKVGSITGLNVALVDGDEITLNLLSGNVSAPVTFNLGTTSQDAPLPIELGVAASDETTALTTGTAKVVFRAPAAFKLSEVRATVSTASTSGAVEINVKKNSTTIFSTNLTIDASEKTSKTAATAYALAATPTNFADDDEIQFDIVAAGTGAKGLKVWLIGVR